MNFFTMDVDPRSDPRHAGFSLDVLPVCRTLLPSSAHANAWLFRPYAFPESSSPGGARLGMAAPRPGSYSSGSASAARATVGQALVSVVATSYLLGWLSIRRVEKLVEQLGVASLSRSQVSEMATYLDAQVVAFRNRPMDSGPYTFVWGTR
jgi:Transposase, Mutator family